LPAWPAGLALRAAVLSDFHACEPWLNANRLNEICDRVAGLEPDIVLLLGDYCEGPRFSRSLEPAEWAACLARLHAPLGVHAVLGNHDYWADAAVQAAEGGPTQAEAALAAAGNDVYINRARRMEKDGRGFWLAGLGDQLAFLRRRRGIDDLDATLGQVEGDEPVLLMAHEPDIFPRVPARVALTLSGHTHGGQVTLFGHSPVIPSRYGDRYRHGHVIEDDRHLVVSAGLGLTWLPVRLGAPPEIVLLELGGSQAA
jgi:predicted MPP superfamily phosphohydrolase